MKFAYEAKNATGQTVKGVAEATNINGAASLLRDKQLIPVKITARNDGQGLASLVGKITGTVSVSDMANFTRQLSTMITAGLPLTDALNLLRLQSPPNLSPVVSSILGDVQSGQALSTGMGKFPKVFSPVYLSLVKAGEAAGIMDKILARLAENTEKSREFRAKVVGAMIYPVIILIGMVLVFVLMILVVVPKLIGLYADFGEGLPLPTRILVGISDFATQRWYIVLAGLIGIAFAYKSFVATPRGRQIQDTIFYRLPVIGPLAQQVMLTELTRTLSLLLSAGVSVVEALNIVSGVVGHSVVREEVKRIGKQVEKGFPMSISFSESGVFPALVGQMMAVGEETGKIDEVLAKLSAYYESESGEKVKALTTAIEPIILIVLAVGVGALMYAIIMPIYGIINKV